MLRTKTDLTPVLLSSMILMYIESVSKQGQSAKSQKYHSGTLCGVSCYIHPPHTHTHPFNNLLSGTTWMSRYQKGKTNLDFTEARDSEWQWHQLGHMQVCTSLQTDNHASTLPLSFLQAGCPSCNPTNRVKALKAKYIHPPLVIICCLSFSFITDMTSV